MNDILLPQEWVEDQSPHDIPRLELSIDDDQSLKVLKALASETRLGILNTLCEGPRNVSEIAKALDLPISTANLHLNILEEAGLLIVDLLPGTRGIQKLCAKAYSSVTLPIRKSDASAYRSTTVSMPIGAFTDCEVAPTCGLCTDTGIIGHLDQPASFYEPNRIHAQRLWFRHGYVEYRFPHRLPPQTTPSNLQLSFEACSEAPLHHYNWPSDISVWINGEEIGSWTSPADFGGERGALTPDWMNIDGSQYGLLKVWRVDRNGTFIDGSKISDVSIEGLQLAQRPYVTVRIGVKPDARHVGGINIFGHGFGNYPQDIVMNIQYF